MTRKSRAMIGNLSNPDIATDVILNMTNNDVIYSVMIIWLTTFFHPGNMLTIMGQTYYIKVDEMTCLHYVIITLSLRCHYVSNVTFQVIPILTNQNHSFSDHSVKFYMSYVIQVIWLMLLRNEFSAWIYNHF